ncbi:MAG: DNA-binding response regulator [Bacteroidetes bacterium]|nr:MAG: DNA-binding response regulator [Bacteroidota bacterium]
MHRTIIIDDEAHQRLTIEKMVRNYCPTLKVVAKAESVQSGLKAIIKHKPDLVLLDIELADGTGFDILDQLHPINFKVIFITAFDQYAIKAFRFSALDYLLKPVDPDELCRAATKAVETIQHDFNLQINNLRRFIKTDDKNHQKIIIKTYDNIHLVPVRDILFCESDNNYTRIHLLDHRQIMVSATLKEYEDILSESGFFRIHKSYLINMKRIIRFERAEGGSVVLEGDIKIPVASRKREELLEILDQLTNF